MSNYNIVTADELGGISASGAAIVDVRTAMEHTQNRLAQPHDHVPLDELDPDSFMLRRGLDRDDPVYILCRSGGRARQAADKFLAAGYPNIHVIEGGLTACEAGGHPTKGTAAATAPGGAGLQKTVSIIPLERQVRIAAGVLVGLGAFLGFALAPVFHLLSLFVGLGLIYAGVTDRCGMGLLLARAPWNQPDRASAQTAATCAITRPAAAKADGGKQEGGCA